MTKLQTSLYLLALITLTTTAPLPPNDPTDPQNSSRQAKSLYFDYIQSDPDLNLSGLDFPSEEVDLVEEQNDLSRTIPSRKRPLYNSPIYYIRMPATPYMYVPGLGYVSQPPPSPVSHFLNLPVSFVANGKPSTVYRWGAFPTPAPRPTPPPVTDSPVHRLHGQFTFNGKPNDIFVLRDSYNEVYSDALQNFYP